MPLSSIQLDKYFEAAVGAASAEAGIGPVADSYTASATLHSLRVKTVCLDAVLREERQRDAQVQHKFKARWRIAAERLRKVNFNISQVQNVYKESLAETERQLEFALRQDELGESKRLEVQKLKKERDFLAQLKLDMMSRLDHYQPIQKYMKHTIEHSQGQFRNERELIDRANLLFGIRTQLVSRNDTSEAKCAKLEKKLERIQTVTANEAILLNNYIFEVSEALLAARTLVNNLDVEVTHVKTTASYQTMVLGQIRTAVYNLYVQMSRTFFARSKINPSDTIKLLNAIKSTMMEIREMETIINFILTKAKNRTDARKSRRVLFAVDGRNKIPGDTEAEDENRKQRLKMQKLFLLGSFDNSN